MTREREVIEKLFQIQNKEGLTVDFKLNNAQTFLDEQDLPYGQRQYRGIQIVKARQKGYSSGVLAKFSVRCMYVPGTHAVVISHEAESTQRLLDRVHFYLGHLRGGLKPSTSRNSRQELFFSKTQSTYYLGTAGARAFGRGDFITDLHCSEYAWWDMSRKHLAGLFQAVPLSGRIYIESTGNGRNNDFYYIFKNAEKLRYKVLFFPWFGDEEYQLQWPYPEPWRPQSTKHADFMWTLKNEFKLSDNQMYWYEDKLFELREDLSLMQQEYPSRPMEAFQATGGAVFSQIPYEFAREWQTVNLESQQAMILYGHPMPDMHYVIGADPSGGTGGDDSALVVYCVETHEQVYEFAYNRLDPVAFGHFAGRIAKHFNMAYIVPEANNHGIAMIAVLKREYSKDKIFRMTDTQWGFVNTSSGAHSRKAELIGLFKELIEEQLIIHGENTKAEMEAFEEKEEGKMEGESDNLVIANALAAVGLRKKAKYRWAYFEPRKPKEPTPYDIYGNYMYYTFDEVMDSVKNKGLQRPSFFPNQYYKA